MSDFACPVVRIESVETHPNADTLSITEVEGGPVIFRTSDFKVGDLAIYLPIESLIPEGRDWVNTHASHLTFRNGVHRLKAARLRKIFSMGMLVPIAAAGEVQGGWKVGDDLTPILGITKFEELEEVEIKPRKKGSILGWIKNLIYRALGIRGGPQPRLFPIYEVGHFRKAARNAFKAGEVVVATEKIHGQNFAACYSSKKKRLIVSSHKVIRGAEDNSNWWMVARKLQLDVILRKFPDLTVYGEIYGADVQDLGYGVLPGQLEAKFFDIYDVKAKEWLAYDDACNAFAAMGLPIVPVVYRGPYERDAVMALRDGKTTLPAPSGKPHIREGVVVRRVREGLIPEDKEVRPRCVLKVINDEYLLRKNPTEKH